MGQALVSFQGETVARAGKRSCSSYGSAGK
jgi:hypothetical protein